MLKCNSKNPKFKNLTIGKDYEGTLDGDFAEVVNDSGVKTRYHKKYFSEVAPTLPFAPPPPPARPVINNLSLVDILNRIHLSNDTEEPEDGTTIVIRYQSIVEEPVYIDRVANSCGVLQFDGMNNIDRLTSIILNQITTSTTEITDVTESILFNAIITKVLRYIRVTLRYRHPFIMLTTNDPTRHMFDTFNARFSAETSSTFTGARENPSSGNDIAVWVIDMDEFLEF